MEINPLPTISQASSTDPYGAFTSDRDGSEDDPRRDDVEQEEAPFATVADENDLLDELENEGDQEPEEDGEELFGDNFEEDYRAIPELDNYDSEMVDDSSQTELSIDARRAAEAEMRKRDRRAGRIPAALDDSESEGDEGRPRRRARVDRGEDDWGMDEDWDEARETEVNLNDRRGMPLHEFLAIEAVRRTIAARFKRFLLSYQEDGSNKPFYGEAIKRMCMHRKSSLAVSYKHLCRTPECAIIAIYLADCPMEMLKILSRVAKDVTLRLVPAYGELNEEIHVRIKDLPVKELIRDIRQNHLNALIRVSGVVTRRTGVLPQLRLVKYDCAKCDAVIGPFTQEYGQEETKVGSCPECQSRGPFGINMEETVYRNYQKITLQESPGSVPAGRTPRHRQVVLTDDLVDSCKPGDEIDVTGIYRNQYDMNLNKQQGFPVFQTLIEANYVAQAEAVDLDLTEEDIEHIRTLAKDPQIGERLVNSIAPAIYGWHNIKLALALAMFGGEAKVQPTKKHRVRGDINVLLLGDPGTAKSQFLKYVEKTAPRVVYTTGQGASAVGLTASVHKDAVTREWTLEGGALVLADRGMCLIDEFDKMNDQDRTSIHEAMEQQSISISKAGIVTSLQARCSVVAAANPRTNVYDPTLSFSQNVNLTEPILSRFDILCVVQDKIDADNDMRLAQFVTHSHVKHHPLNREALEDMAKANEVNEVTEDRIPQAVLRKYIKYARTKCTPRLQHVDVEKLTATYIELRREAALTQSIPITVRHLESMIRMAEAHARMHLREFVHEEDVNMAIRVMLESFISTQKVAVVQRLQARLSRFLTYKKDHNELLLHVLNQAFTEHMQYLQARRGAVPDHIELQKEDFEAQARAMKLQDLSAFYGSELFASRGYELDKARKVIVKRPVGAAH